MKKLVLTFAVAATAMMAFNTSANAQECSSCDSGGYVDGGGYADGGASSSFDASSVYQGRRYHPLTAVRKAKQDHLSPHRLYAYSHHGVDATLTDNWNRSRMQSTSWHGNYNYWRWGAPTALVVPPTAAFQTSYAWGVGQTKSLPINHQFGRGGAGMSGGGGGAFGNTPYWPSSTDQFGVYPVRGPWE